MARTGAGLAGRAGKAGGVSAASIAPKHFASAASFRRWLERYHASRPELWIGFYNRKSGRGGLTYPEAVEQALCFGWIDGVARAVDSTRHAQRFTPRRRRSHWSAINVRRFNALEASGQIRPAGQAAFAAWNGKKAPYSLENRHVTLTPAFRARFIRQTRAWQWFSSAPPGYRRTAIFWVMSAKQATTRQRRLETLIADSASGLRIRLLRRPETRTAAR